MRRIMVSAIVALGCCATPLVGQSPSPDKRVATMSADEEALLGAEDMRFKAELTHDAGTLDRMTAPDVVYSHFNGAQADKAAVMQTFTHLPFSSITPSDRTARIIGTVGIVRGKVTRQLPDRTLSDGYLAVYVRRDGRWQLLEWVSAAVPLARNGQTFPAPATP